MARGQWRKQAGMGLEIKGVAPLLAELQRRNSNVAKKAIRRAVTVGGRVVRNVARPLVATDSKTLRRSLGVVERQYRRVVGGEVRVQRVAVVGPRVNGNKYWAIVRRTKGKMFAVTSLEKPEKISHLVSGGAKPHFIRLGKTRLIAHPGFSGSKFMERAAQQASPQVVAQMESIIMAAVNGQNVSDTATIGE